MTRLSIPGMTCGHCKSTVTLTLAAVPGVATVEVNLEDRSADVTGSAPDALLLTALDRAGYPATATQ